MCPDNPSQCQDTFIANTQTSPTDVMPSGFNMRPSVLMVCLMQSKYDFGSTQYTV